MGRRVLGRHIWGYSVCLCPIKGTPGLYELKSIARTAVLIQQFNKIVLVVFVINSKQNVSNMHQENALNLVYISYYLGLIFFEVIMY